MKGNIILARDSIQLIALRCPSAQEVIVGGVTGQHFAKSPCPLDPKSIVAQ